MEVQRLKHGAFFLPLNEVNGSREINISFYEGILHNSEKEMLKMARNFYQVTKDGKDIPGVRWATEKMAKDTLEIEMDYDLQELQKQYPDGNYTRWFYREEGVGIITKERRESVMEGVDTIYRARVHRYGIRVGEVGEEKKHRYEMTMDFASK